MAADKTQTGVLRRRSADILGAGPFWAVPDLELDGVAFPEIVEPFALDRTLMEEVVLPTGVLDEPKALVYS